MTPNPREEAPNRGASPLPLVQFVSKAIIPPFRDGTKCFVRDLTNHLDTVRPLVLGGSELSNALTAEVVPLYARAGGFAPGLRDNATAFLWLLTRSRANLWHFVFAPNPRSSQMARALRSIRKIPTVQTIASPPRSFDSPGRLLFGDCIVTQSRWTRDQFLGAYQALGQAAPRIDVIPPIAPRVGAPDPGAILEVRRALGVKMDTELLVYPGDLEMSQGAGRVAELARAIASQGLASPPVIVFAYRNKTPRAKERAEELERALASASVRFLPETPHIHALLATARLILFPVDDLFGKVDLPIVLLEALRLGTPVLTSGEGPLAELRLARQIPWNVEAWMRELSELRRVPEQGGRDLGAHEPELVARAYEALYAELLKTGGAAR